MFPLCQCDLPMVIYIANTVEKWEPGMEMNFSIEYVIFVVNYMQKRVTYNMFISNDELVVGTRHMINASTISIEQKKKTNWKCSGV